MNFNVTNYETFCNDINELEDEFLSRAVLTHYNGLSAVDQKVYQSGLQALHTIIRHAMTPQECEEEYILPPEVNANIVLKERLLLDFCMHLHNIKRIHEMGMPARYRVRQLIQQNHIPIKGISQKFNNTHPFGWANLCETILDTLSNPQVPIDRLAALKIRYRHTTLMLEKNQDAIARRVDLLRIATGHCYLRIAEANMELNLSVLIPALDERRYCAKVLARRDPFLLAQSLYNFDLDGDSVLEVAELIVRLATHFTALNCIIKCGVDIKSYSSRIDALLQDPLPPKNAFSYTSPFTNNQLVSIPQQALANFALCGHQWAWDLMTPAFKENQHNALAAIRYQPDLFNCLTEATQKQIMVEAASTGNVMALQLWWKSNSDILVSTPDTILAALAAVLINDRQRCEQADKSVYLDSMGLVDERSFTVLETLIPEILQHYESLPWLQNPRIFEENWHQILKEQAEQGSPLAWCLLPTPLKSPEIAKSLGEKRPDRSITNPPEASEAFKQARNASGYLDLYLHSYTLDYSKEVYEKAFKNNRRMYRFLPPEMRQEPKNVRDYLRSQPWEMETVYVELGRPTWMQAANQFALVVACSDGLLRLKQGELPNEAQVKARRFFQIAGKLPLELQMVLTNRLVGSGKTIVNGRDTEWALLAALLPL